MLRVRLTFAALADFKAIGRYTQKTWGRAQRNKYLAALDYAFQQLAKEPELGRACDAIRLGYRKHQVGRLA